MKRKIILMTMLLFSIFLMQGCVGNGILPISTDTSVMEKKIQSNMEKMGSFTMNSGVSIHFFGIESYTDAVTNIDNKNNIIYSKSETKAEFPEEAKDVVDDSSLSLVMENYSIRKEKDLTDSYFTSKEVGGKWFHEKLNYEVGKIDYSWINDLKLENEDIDINGISCVKFSGDVDYGKLASVIDILGMNSLGIEGIDKDLGGASVVLYVKKNQYRPIRLEIDLNKADRENMNEYKDDELLDAQVYDLLLNDFKLSFYIDFSNYNNEKSEVKSIPENIISNAVEKE